ncbi:IS1634 family transposase [candidate division KSB1 bacterium]|nr:IS1634 family transposase [candidate division KSB1 bacterium]
MQLVESYRDANKQPATRVIANLGNISTLSDEQIDHLTVSFIKAIGAEQRFQKTTITAGKGYHYGSCLPVMAIWNELNLDGIINHALSDKITIPVTHITLIQIANRFSDPGSKLACYRWFEYSLFSQLHNFVHFPDDDAEKLHMYYRSLDYLCAIKNNIEQQLYYHFKSYNTQNTLLFYDLTSVYFEGEQADMAVPGYSRDHRPDADQIVIGLVMNGDGIPIAHHVFEGNTVDKTTVATVVDDLEQRFGIKDIIFVGDRGLLTRTNVKLVKRHGYDYFLGMQKRNRRIINFLMNACPSDAIPNDSDRIVIKEIGYSELSADFQADYESPVRFIICHDKNTAMRQRKRRERNIAKFEHLITTIQYDGLLTDMKKSYHKLRSFLAKYHMSNFWDIEIVKNQSDNAGSNEPPHDHGSYQLQISKNDEVITFEQQLDGHFFLQTEVSDQMLDKQAIVHAYKSLQKVERAFEFSKNEIDIRPVYVRRESRIKGHVMICFLSLLIETLLEKTLFDVFPEMVKTKNKQNVVKQAQRKDTDGRTMITLREELDTIRLVPLYLNDDDLPHYVSTAIANNLKRLFSALGIVNSADPINLRFKGKNQNQPINQLEFNLRA